MTADKERIKEILDILYNRDIIGMGTFCRSIKALNEDKHTDTLNTINIVYNRAFEQGQRTHSHSSDCETCKEIQEQAFEQGRKEEQFKIREEVRVRAAEQNYSLAQAGQHEVATELLQLLEWFDSQSLDARKDKQEQVNNFNKEDVSESTMRVNSKSSSPDSDSSSRDTSLSCNCGMEMYVHSIASHTPEFHLGEEQGSASERAKIEKMIKERIKELDIKLNHKELYGFKWRIIELNSLLEKIKGMNR